MVRSEGARMMVVICVSMRIFDLPYKSINQSLPDHPSRLVYRILHQELNCSQELIGISDHDGRRDILCVLRTQERGVLS
jgi:hypothetical protein